MGFGLSVLYLSALPALKSFPGETQPCEPSQPKEIKAGSFFPESSSDLLPAKPGRTATGLSVSIQLEPHSRGERMLQSQEKPPAPWQPVSAGTCGVPALCLWWWGCGAETQRHLCADCRFVRRFWGGEVCV